MGNRGPWKFEAGEGVSETPTDVGECQGAVEGG